MSNYIGQTVITTTDDIRNVQHDFSNFTAFNNVLIVSSSNFSIYLSLNSSKDFSNIVVIWFNVLKNNGFILLV